MYAIVPMPRALESNLTKKQKLFVAAFLGEASGNAKRAAELAGYGAANAVATRLLKHAGISAAILEQTEKEDRREIMSVEARKKRLTEIAKSDDASNCIKAIDTLNKLDSLYINRTEVNFEGYDSAKLNAESAEIMKLEGWVCFPPNHPRVQEARELLE